ncbi:MAG: NIL domain-containing protein [Armatimonadetes bacterium]|nr:NIL domain-containing protein [Armatimonadota bacterium]
MVSKVELTLVASNDSVGQPWLWRLAKEFSVKVNIVKANVDQESGWAIVELEGPLEEVQRATAWLMTTGLHVEAAQRSVGA